MILVYFLVYFCFRVFTCRMDDNDGVGLNIYNIFNREEDIIIFIF